MARGIKDKVVILGMGCSKFGERWDSGAEELMLEAYKECLKDAGIDQNQLQAAWFSTAIDEVHVGKSGIPLSTTLRLPNIPVTHVENMCASGSEAFRNACYAVASGACDIALALGVEKLKDTGYGGLPGGRGGPLHALMECQRHGARQFRPTGHGLSTAHEVGRRGPQEGDRPRLVEEPPERRQEPQGPSAEGRRDGDHPERADDRLAAGPVRLLRRVRRRGGGHRHHARDRQGAGQEGPGHRQGAAALGLQRLGVGPQFVGRQLLPHHAHRLEEGLRRSRHQEPARRDLDVRGARLLLDHRAGDHGRPAHLRDRQGLEGRARRLLRRRRQRSPARSTAA